MERFGNLAIYSDDIPEITSLVPEEIMFIKHMIQACEPFNYIYRDQNYKFTNKLVDLFGRIAVADTPISASARIYQTYLTHMHTIFEIRSNIQPSFAELGIPDITIDSLHAAASSLGITDADDVITDLFRVKGTAISDGSIDHSENNYYGSGITDAIYNNIHASERHINSYFELNNDGKLIANNYSCTGKYATQLTEVVRHLNAAADVASAAPSHFDEATVQSIRLLIEFFRTGDEDKFREHCRAWIASKSRIQYTMGFIETYKDPRGVIGEARCSSKLWIKSLLRFLFFSLKILSLYTIIICLMLKPKKPPRSLTSLCLLSESGQEMVTSHLIKLSEDTTCILSQTLKKKHLPVHQSTKSVEILFTQESLPENNTKILKDKVNFCEKSIPPTLSSKTSVLESTSKDQDLKPYWNNSLKELSKKLWLPTKIDFPDLASTFSNGCLHTSTPFWNLSINQNQNMTCWKTLWKFLPSLQPVITEQESMLEKREQKKEKIQKAKEAKKLKEPSVLQEPLIEREVIKGRPISRKIHIYPNQLQKEKFKLFFGTHRYFFNRTVAYLNDQYEQRKQEFNNSITCIICDKSKVDDKEWLCITHKNLNKVKIPWNISFNLQTIRSKVMKTNEKLSEEEKWQEAIPYNTREYGIREAIAAFKSAITNKKNSNIEEFEIKFKTHYDNRKTFMVDKRAISNKKGNLIIFKTILPDFIRVTKRNKRILPETFDFNCQIMYDKGQYFLLVPFDEPIQEKEDARFESVALDPGVRAFQTGYSAEGVLFKAGEKVSIEIDSLYDEIDYLKSKKSKSKGQKKNQLKKRIWKLQTKIKNKIQNLHNHLAISLT